MKNESCNEPFFQNSETFTFGETFLRVIRLFIMLVFLFSNKL